MNPLPTPFDITDIPYFPPEAGPVLWIGVFLFFTLLSGAAFIPRRRKRISHPSSFSPFSEAEAAIKKTSAAKTIKKEELFELCRKLKTVIHAYEEQDLSALGPKGLAELSVPGKRDALAEYLNHIAELEKIKYTAKLEQARTRQILSDTLAALIEYKLLVRASIEEEQNADPAK